MTINPIARALALAAILGSASSQSLIPISTFTDFKCNIASTTAEDVSVPLDACITTTGMVSFHMDALPCSGGGLTAVKSWGFSDAHCNNRFTYFDYGSGCYGAFNNNNAFGSILLTCTDDGTDAPRPQGSPITIAVGPTVTGAANNSSGSAAGSGSSSSSSSSSDDSSEECHGWTCLSLGLRITIIVGASVAAPAAAAPVVVKKIKRAKEAKARAEALPMYQQSLVVEPYQKTATVYTEQQYH